MRKMLLSFVLLVSAGIGNARGEMIVKETGDSNRVLVMIPGFACSGDVWDETAAALSLQYHCLQLTLPGFAGAVPTEQPSFQKMEEQIVGELLKRHIQKASFIGHSMGGGLAMAIAADYPEMVESVCIVDALPCLSALYNPAFKANPDKDYSAEVERFMSMDDEQYKRTQQMGAATQTCSPERIPTILDWVAKTDRRTYISMYHSYSNTDLRETLNRVQTKMLVLLEPQFRGIENTVRHQFAGKKDTEIHFASKGLHFIMYDDWDWYINHIMSFFNYHVDKAV